MRAFSIQYPWLGLILDGKKTLDIRTWRVKYRGVVLLHASTSYDHSAPEALKQKYPRGAQQVGGIVGRAVLNEVIRLDWPLWRKLRKQHHCPDGFYIETKPMYGFKLVSAQRVPFERCKGQNRLWHWTPDQIINGDEQVNGKTIYCGKGCGIQVSDGRIMPDAAFCKVSGKFECGVCPNLVVNLAEIPEAEILADKKLTKPAKRKKAKAKQE